MTPFLTPIRESYTFLDAAILGGDTVEITGYVTDRAGYSSEGLFRKNFSSGHCELDIHTQFIGDTRSSSARGARWIDELHSLCVAWSLFCHFDPDVMTVDSVKSTGRVPFSPFYESTIDSISGQGILSVVLVDLAGRPDTGSERYHGAHLYVYQSERSARQTMLLRYGYRGGSCRTRTVTP